MRVEVDDDPECFHIAHNHEVKLVLVVLLEQKDRLKKQ